MANRLIGNVYIVDSALNNVALPWNAGSRISSIRAWFLDTTGIARFTGADTTDAVCVLIANAPAAGTGTTDQANLENIAFDNMKIPALTAGTAWIYLS